MTSWGTIHGAPSPMQASPAQIEGVSAYSPCLFGKRTVVHARQACKQQTNFLKQNFSETTTPIGKSGILLLNL